MLLISIPPKVGRGGGGGVYKGIGRTRKSARELVLFIYLFIYLFAQLSGIVTVSSHISTGTMLSRKSPFKAFLG